MLTVDITVSEAVLAATEAAGEKETAVTTQVAASEVKLANRQV